MDTLESVFIILSRLFDDSIVASNVHLGIYLSIHMDESQTTVTKMMEQIWLQY